MTAPDTSSAPEALPAIIDVHIKEIGDAGLRGRGADDAVLDVSIDGRLLWSLRFLRDSEPVDGGRLAPWPEDLPPYLHGSARFRVQEHETGVVLYDEEVRLGQGTGRITVMDAAGRPLSVMAKGHLAALLSQRGPETVQQMLDAAEDVLAIMRGVGVDGFLGYGTLLGAVRSGHVIAHDYDMDLCYLSDREYPVDAIGESYRIERALLANGYPIRRYSAMAFQIGLDPSDPRSPWLDVFGSLIVDDMLYVLWDVGAPVRREQVLPLGTCRLEGRELPAPRDAEAWLTATYGPTWRVPDPAFRYETPPTVARRMRGWFGRLHRGQRGWEEQYGGTDAAPDAQPSGFARWVARREPGAGTVADIGCGLGTDAAWYAEKPYSGQAARVLGLDYSDVALTKAAGRSVADGSPVTFRHLDLSDLRSVLATGATLARLPGRRVLTARYVADALRAPERRNLWLLGRMACRGEGALYLEIARAQDPRHPEFAEANRLFRLPSPQLRAECEAAGAQVSARSVVESPATSHIPDTIRMVLSWPR